MTVGTVQRVGRLAAQLIETLMTAAICAEEIRAAVDAEHDGNSHAVARSFPGLKPNGQRPLLDDSTLCVIWKGRSLRLGHTMAFRVLERLSRRPNQFVTHHDLLQDVWEDDLLELATIRSTVRHLRRRLRDGGMEELATAIRGHNGRYILEL